MPPKQIPDARRKYPSQSFHRTEREERLEGKHQHSTLERRETQRPHRSTRQRGHPPKQERGGKRKEISVPSSHPRSRSGSEDVRACHLTATHDGKRAKRHRPSSGPRISSENEISFATSELANPPGSGDLANFNPFAGNSGETSRIEMPHSQPEDSGEGWTFQGKRRLPVRFLSSRQDLAETPTRSPHLVTTPGGKGKRGQTHSEMHHSYFEALGISVPEGQEFYKARIWPVLSREKDKKEQILVHARNQTLSDLPLSIRVTGPPEERWTHTSAQEDLILRLEAELEEKVLRYKLAVRSNLHLEWSWQAEPGRGGMECTILAHVRTGSSALSVQNKRHLHWKELESISTVTTLLWPSVGVKPNTWKKLGLESSVTPKNLEDDLEDQNTSHWGVLGVIGKVVKLRYRKCPRILDLDICNPSYGQKKGRESN